MQARANLLTVTTNANPHIVYLSTTEKHPIKIDITTKTILNSRRRVYKFCIAIK